MAERYDAAIIGAGADGLVAAALLGRAGLRAVVLERQPQPGGLLVTRQFHPGFFAAPFADDVAPVDDALFRFARPRAPRPGRCRRRPRGRSGPAGR